METDNFQPFIQNIRFTDNEGKSTDQGIENIDARMQIIDAKEKKRLRLLTIGMSAGALFFLLLIFLPPGEEWNLGKTGRFLLFIAYLCLALIGYMGRRALAGTDYGLPVLQRLKKMEKSFQFFDPRIWFVFPLIIILDASCSFIILDSCYIPCDWALWIRIATAQSVFLLILAIGFFFGYKDWKKNRKPTYDWIKAAIKELNGE